MPIVGDVVGPGRPVPVAQLVAAGRVGGPTWEAAPAAGPRLLLARRS